jgi:nicotinamidase-related amidase
MSQTVLVLLDIKQAIVDIFPDMKDSYLSSVSRVIGAARDAGIPIIYVKTCFRRGHPEVSSRNFSGARISSHGGFVEGDQSVQICPEVAPGDEDIIVTKRRVSAFSGSDFGCVLRGLNADKLVLAGIATSGAVLSTVREAADLDYSLTVLENLCLDRDEEVHRVLVEKVLSKQVDILTSEKWIGKIGASD